VAVYDRRYRGYDGSITPLNSRFMVLPRFAWAQVFKSRPVQRAFFTMCFAWPIAATLWIYLHHNFAAWQRRARRAPTSPRSTRGSSPPSWACSASSSAG
jgi:hypothetical protein